MTTTDNLSTTDDVFQRGRFTLVQPAKGAHRAGLDALLLASVLPAGFKGRVMDLGAGAGAIGFALAANHPEAQVTLVENDPLMLKCAARGLAHTDNAAFSSRIAIINADIMKNIQALEAEGLQQNRFDSLLTNPPYNLSDMQPSSDAIRAKAHHAADDIFEQWLRVAAGLLKPKGLLGLIARPQALPMILTALNRRFGHITIIPIHAHEGEDAIRIILTATKASRAGLLIKDGLALHDKKTRAYKPKIDQLLNGQLRMADL